MSGTFIDAAAARFRGPSSELPRGLVRPPQEVEEHVAHEKARLRPFYSDCYAKRALDDLTLAFYFEGLNVAYRSVEQGVEVLAVGDEEIGRLTRSLDQEQLLTIQIKQP